MANNNHFNLTLDTIGPVLNGNITVVKTPVNGTAQLKFSAKDQQAGEAVGSATGTPSLMKVWADTLDGSNSHPTTEPNSAWIAYANHSSTAYNLSLPSGDNTYYAHIIFMDDVGNKSSIYNSSAIVCDRTAPSISAFTITDPSVVSPQSSSAYTNQLQNNVSVTFADNTGGVGISNIKFVCSDFASDITSTASGTSYSGTITFKSGTAAGSKTVNAYVQDAAGNWSAAKSATIYYDPNPATAVLELHKTNSYNSVVDDYISRQTSGAYASVYARIDITSASPDVIGYKIWGDLVDKATEPSSYTSVTSGTDPIDIGAVSFSSGDGVKTVHAKVVDRAGNETTLTNVVVTIDSVNPVPTIVSISPNQFKESGSATLTYKVTDNTSGTASGIKSWNIKINGSQVTSGTAAVASNTTLTINKNTTGVTEGTNTITITAEDKAGNTATTSSTFIYDKTGPVVSITSPSGIPWKNAAFNVTVSSYDTYTGVDKVYVWATTSSTKPSAIPDGTQYTTVNSSASSTGTSTTVDSAKVNFSSQQQGTNYLWAAAVDKVGNITISSTGVQYKYDDVKPTCDFSFSQAAYASTTASVTVTFSDATSGASIINLTGNITNVSHQITDTERTNGSATISVTLTTGDGEKTVNATVTDVAGNVSTTATHKCELDTSNPTVSLVLKEADGSTAKVSPGHIDTFKVVVTFTDDALTAYGTGAYKIWSNVAITGISAQSEANANWVNFSTGGSKTITLGTFTALTEGNQTISIKVKDNAGNASSVASVTWVYTVTPPECGITTNPDYIRISKQTSYRYSGTTVTTKKNNEITFSFGIVTAAGSSTLSEDWYNGYRVCAYWSQAAAAEGSYADTSYIIPTTNGSTNTSGGSGNAGASNHLGQGAITTKINGTDYETALKASAPSGTTNWDGAHIVVAYICNDAGVWSVAAQFEA